MQSSTPTFQFLPHDVVAVAAYYHWLKAGQPSGRDHEFWLKAEAQLRKTMAPRDTARVECPETKPAGEGSEPTRNRRLAGPHKVSGRNGRQRRMTSA
jgi:Protein of unknown function (DUF2934)